MSEETCHYVASRGILKSCDIHSPNPESSCVNIDRDFSKVFPGCTIYICTKAVSRFAEKLETLPKFILVTGDCDEDCNSKLFSSEEDFEQFVNSEKLIHWYTQNIDYSHPKISPIPIGLDYHTVSSGDHPWSPQKTPSEQEQELMSITREPFWTRKIKCYSNFHFNNLRSQHGGDRIEAISQIDSSLVYYEPSQTNRLTAWKRQSEYAFVISPHGNGRDCHRTWEGLANGCIVIVKTSPLDSLFDDLPVLIVKSWSDVTQKLLEETVENFKTRVFDYNRISLEYWIRKIKTS